MYIKIVVSAEFRAINSHSVQSMYNKLLLTCIGRLGLIYTCLICYLEL